MYIVCSGKQETLTNLINWKPHLLTISASTDSLSGHKKSESTPIFCSIFIGKAAVHVLILKMAGLKYKPQFN